MVKFIFSILMIACLLTGTTTAGAGADLARLTAECVAASRAFREIHDDFAYKVLHTVHYTGWSGDADHAALTFPVRMQLRWAGTNKRGHYWFLKAPDRKYAVRVTSDADGNIRMVSTDENGRVAQTFKGKMKDGVIKGLWAPADGGEAFGYWVKAD